MSIWILSGLFTLQLPTAFRLFVRKRSWFSENVVEQFLCASNMMPKELFYEFWEMAGYLCYLQHAQLPQLMTGGKVLKV